MSNLDVEVKALRKLERILRPFDAKTRQRLLAFLKRDDDEIGDDGEDNGGALTGRSIRTVAIAVLREHGHNGCSPERAHYKDWYALLLAHGYEVKGKPPEATFLTNITRSPLVERSTEEGVYRLNLDRPKALRKSRDNMQEELAQESDPDRCRKLLVGLRAVDAQLREVDDLDEAGDRS